MDSFMMAARVVVPMALMMLIGIALRITKIADPATMKKMDTITFKVFSPCLVFYNIYNTDFSTLSNFGYLLYGMAGLCVVFVGCILFVPRMIPEGPRQRLFPSPWCGLILLFSEPQLPRVFMEKETSAW